MSEDDHSSRDSYEDTDNSNSDPSYENDTSDDDMSTQVTVITSLDVFKYNYCSSRPRCRGGDLQITSAGGSVRMGRYVANSLQQKATSHVT